MKLNFTLSGLLPESLKNISLSTKDSVNWRAIIGKTKTTSLAFLLRGQKIVIFILLCAINAKFLSEKSPLVHSFSHIWFSKKTSEVSPGMTEKTFEVFTQYESTYSTTKKINNG